MRFRLFSSITLLVVILSVCLVVPVISEERQAGETMTVPLGKFEIKAPESAELKRSIVKMPHSLHFFDYNCMECHHMWDGESEIESCATAGCHDLTSPEESPTDIAYYKNAYHAKCINCHKSQKAKRTKMAAYLKKGETLPGAGPTSCIACHPKDGSEH